MAKHAYYNESLVYLKGMLGDHAEFRTDQQESIQALVSGHKKMLLVQKTGWGKSIVYFIATKLLRENGNGPTLLISPLLSLMRNQIQMADKIGIRAATINSDNREEWERIRSELAQSEIDILLVSPERLANRKFITQVLKGISTSVGLFVVDEAHCISDWGHDFRPDYQRITNIIKLLPPSVPVLCTTATANDRVIRDIQLQLGTELEIIRGPLARSSLRLNVLSQMTKAERLAWIARNLPYLEGSGIIYCLTKRDVDLVTDWLSSRGFPVEQYYSGCEDREGKERMLIDNRVKALVATVALGMGFDKPDIGFIIHFQRPGSVIAYYQQVGRAGRAIDNAEIFLMNGAEDDEIQEYFIRTAFPPVPVMNAIVQALEEDEGLRKKELMRHVNATYRVINQALTMLLVEGAIEYDNNRYYRTVKPWQVDKERINRILSLRENELKEMQGYLDTDGCLMQYLCKAMDDSSSSPCGRCMNCRGELSWHDLPQELVEIARAFCTGRNILLPIRKRFPAEGMLGESTTIGAAHRVEQGRVLCYYNDGILGKLVANGKYRDRRFSDRLVRAAAQKIRGKWFAEMTETVGWDTAIPSLRHPVLVYNLAARIAKDLGLPFIPVFKRIQDAPEQKTMENSTFQAQNVINSLSLEKETMDKPVLLIDDVYDSGWTMTIAGWLLRENGSGAVYPFALATASKGRP